MNGLFCLGPYGTAIMLKFERPECKQSLVESKAFEICHPLVLRAERGQRKSRYGQVLAPEVTKLQQGGVRRDSLVINWNSGTSSSIDMDGVATILGQMEHGVWKWTSNAPPAVTQS